VPERERGCERVDLVRRREHLARLRLRQRPAGGVRQVLLLDGRADSLGVPRESSVLGADVPLEVGKLAYELRRLVGLRQPRRLECRLAAAELRDEAPEPLRLVREGARALEVGDRAEALGERVDPDPHVALEREARVVQPALEHVLVAGPHDLGIAAVRDEGEPVTAQREVALV